MNITRKLSGITSIFGILLFIALLHVIACLPALMLCNEAVPPDIDWARLLQGQTLQLFFAKAMWSELWVIPPLVILFAGGVFPLTLLLAAGIAYLLIYRLIWRYVYAGLSILAVGLIPFMIGALILHGNEDEMKAWNWVSVQYFGLLGCTLACIVLSVTNLFSESDLPQDGKLAETRSLKRDLRKGAVAGITIIFLFIVASYVDWKIHDRPAVYRPLSALQSVMTTMVSSSNEIVYLNLGEIGPDDNYLCFEPKNNRVEIRFPMYDERQIKYRDVIKKVCSALSLPFREIVDNGDDGDTLGTDYVFIVSGTPTEMSDILKRVVMETFQIKETDLCDFDYVDQPGMIVKE